jgi:HSP20 family protein
MTTNLTRWDPFRDMVSLNDAVNQLMREAFVRPVFASAGDVLMNIVEQPNQYIVQVLLPGVKPEDIDLTCERERVTIHAHRQAFGWEQSSSEKDQPRFLLQEWGEGDFTRTITLPKPVEPDHVTAEFEQGILTLKLPVAAHAQAKKIAIKEGGTVKQLAGSTSRS